MSFEEIKEIRARVAAKLNKLENTDDVLELTLEELSAISGGEVKGSVESYKTCYGEGGTYPGGGNSNCGGTWCGAGCH